MNALSPYPFKDVIAAQLSAPLPSLRKYAIQLCGNRSDADDLMQDAFVRALSTEHYTETGQFVWWVCRIARNRHRNQRARRREVEDADDALALGLSSHERPDDGLIYSQLQASVKKAMARVPPEYGKILAMVQDARSYEEMAAALSIRTQTVKTRIHRLRLYLQQELYQDGFLETPVTGKHALEMLRPAKRPKKRRLAPRQSAAAMPRSLG